MRWATTLFSLLFGSLTASLGISGIVHSTVWEGTAVAILLTSCGFALLGIGVTGLTIIGVEDALKELKKELNTSNTGV